MAKAVASCAQRSGCSADSSPRFALQIVRCRVRVLRSYACGLLRYGLRFALPRLGGPCSAVQCRKVVERALGAALAPQVGKVLHGLLRLNLYEQVAWPQSMPTTESRGGSAEPDPVQHGIPCVLVRAACVRCGMVISCGMAFRAFEATP